MPVKYGTAGNQQFCASTNDVCNRLQTHAAIDFNAEVQPALPPNSYQFRDFMQRTGNEFLSAKPWIDRHHEHHVHHVEYFRERLDRRRRIDHYSRLAAMVSNQLQRPVQMDACLLMHRDPVSSGLSKVWNKAVSVLNHQVHVKDSIGHRPQPLYDRRANCNVGHKMPIHHIKMNDGCATLDGGQNVVGQVGKIGRQNRRCKFDQNKRFPMSGDSHDFINIDLENL